MITIFTKAHREGILYEATAEEIKAYDENIDEYFKYLTDTALKHGSEIKFNHDDLPEHFIDVFGFDEAKENEFLWHDAKCFWTWLDEK